MYSISVGAIVAARASHGSNNMTLRIKKSCHLNVLHSDNGGYIGGVVQHIGKASSIIDVFANELSMKCSTNANSACGIVAGDVDKGHVLDVNWRGNIIKMEREIRTVNASEEQQPQDNEGFMGAFGHLMLPHEKFKFNMRVDRLMIKGSPFSSGAAVIGFVEQSNANEPSSLDTTQNIIVISGAQIDIQTGSANAVGIAQSDATQGKIFSPIFLLSLNGTLGTPEHILAPSGLSCKGSMVDWSGVHLNTNRLGCNDTLELNTVHPEQWRQAHSLVTTALCQDNRSCFYVNEDFLALVDGRNNTFFLVTRQRYPQNSANDKRGVVRVTRYAFSDLQNKPSVDTSFALNGTLLFTHGTEVLLPTGKPLSASLTDDHHLSMFYGAVGKATVALMPLMASNDTVYTASNLNIQMNDVPIQSDNEMLWLRRATDLWVYNVSSSETQQFSSENVLSDHATVIGVKSHHNYVYVVQQMPDRQHITVTRLYNNGTSDTSWSMDLPHLNDYVCRQLYVEGDADKPFISLPKITELSRSHFSSNFYVTVNFSPQGGAATWRYGNETYALMLPIFDEMLTNNKTSTFSNEATQSVEWATMVPKATNVPLDHNNDTSNYNGVMIAGIITPVMVGIGCAGTAIAVVAYCKHKKKRYYAVNKKCCSHTCKYTCK